MAFGVNRREGEGRVWEVLQGNLARPATGENRFLRFAAKPQGGGSPLPTVTKGGVENCA